MEAPVYHLDKVVKAKTEDMEDFDGPLDLILHLLGKHKIEIRDIQISSLLEQYLDWMERRERLDMEVASEFVAMAAHLVYLKTRTLLAVDDQEVLGEMEQLMAALEQRRNHESYTRIKAVTDLLEGRYEYGRDYITKPPEGLPNSRQHRYAHQPNDLARVMQLVLRRMEGRRPPTPKAFEGIVGREPYPVPDKARAIVDLLNRYGVTRFRALFSGSRSRSEVVATFLAILELCKSSRVLLAGSAEDCTVTSTGAEGELELNVDYLN